VSTIASYSHTLILLVPTLVARWITLEQGSERILRSPLGSADMGQALRIASVL